MSHRLKELRKNDLKLSLDRFTEIIGAASENPEKWYPEKISRVERGDTRLNDEIVEAICNAFPGIEPWHLYVDPKTLPSENDKEILARYHKLESHLKAAVDAILFKREEQKQP